MQLQPTYPVLTKRLALRPAVPEDTDAIFRYRSREDVCRYLPFAPQTREQLADRFADTPVALTDEGQYLTLAVSERESGVLVGDAVLMWHSREQRAGEIGYIVHPDYAGNGYATEAGAALLRLGFHDLGLHRIVGRLDARNTASARVLEKLGMRCEAHFVQNEFLKGEWTDELVYAVLASEWRDPS